MITLTNINKYYQSGQGKYHALRNINLTFPDRGLNFIVGKSGSGKSTLLNVIGGIDNYDSGDLQIDNVSTKDFSKKDYNAYRNTYIGFIFQEFNVIKSLSVYDNIALSIELQHQNVHTMHQKILDIIERVGLKGKENRRMNEISGGEKQRVAIARALIKNPKVIIADEPTGNLDSKNRDIIMNLLHELSKDRLVIVVTHDRNLASIYHERIITIKDGAITSDESLINQEISSNQLTITPIAPSVLTSLTLAWKSFKLNRIRFIFIIILFTISLIFSGIVVNLFIANPSKEYAKYQDDYGSFVVSLNQAYTNRNITTNSAFFTYEFDQLSEMFEKNNVQSFNSMVINSPIDMNSTNTDNFYTNDIKRIITFDNDASLLDKIKPFDIPPQYEETANVDYRCYITDYLAKSLIENNYFNNINMTIEDVLLKEIKLTNFIKPLTIEKIIDTNYENFDGANMDDSKVYGAFIDNQVFYASVFVLTSTYENMISPTNIPYTFDNIIYEALGKTGTQEGIKFTTYNSTYKFVNDNCFAPDKPKKGEPTQVAVSTALFNYCFGISNESIIFTKAGVSIDGAAANTFTVIGTERVPAALSFVITGVFESDEFIICTPTTSQSELYSNYLNASYYEGGYMLMMTSDSLDDNSAVYDSLFNNITTNSISDVVIDNVSFIKLQLVKQFINDNILFFAGLFFVFCLFSVLMIFNFIIINIKNSTKDIGIYMSLGMSGFRISLIYLFQVLMISLISMIVALIGTTIFLFVLDSIFSSQALIDFSIINMTSFGIFVIIIIAFITPMLTIFIPLLNLSNKKPIDVIKSS